MSIRMARFHGTATLLMRSRPRFDGNSGKNGLTSSFKFKWQ